jgi:hypothetical protein
MRFASYNRHHVTYKQMLSLIHVWASDHPGQTTEAYIDPDSAGQPVYVTITSTQYGNLSFDSRAKLEEIAGRAGRFDTFSIYLDKIEAEVK